MTYRSPKVQLKLNMKHLKIVKIRQPKFRNWNKIPFLNKLWIKETFLTKLQNDLNSVAPKNYIKVIEMQAKLLEQNG